MFRTNIYNYIVTNIWNITQQFQLPLLTDQDDDVVMESLDDNAETTAETSTDITPPPDADEQDETANSTAAGASNPSPPTTEAYSLREWFYVLTDVDKEALIHAVYPTADTNKIFILCEKSKAVKVLQIIHNLVHLVGIDFPDEALPVYFGTNKQNPAVQNHPKATPQTTAYSSHLTSYATAGNS